MANSINSGKPSHFMTDFLSFMANLATVKAKISVKMLNQDTDNINNTYATMTESLCNEGCNLFA